MPIPLAPPPHPDPKAWPAMEITETGGETRIVETWPMSVSEIADIGLTISGAGPDIVLSVTPGEPLTCAWTAEQLSRYKRPGWDVAIRSQVTIRATAGDFLVEERTLAELNGETVADMKHQATIPRVLA